MSVRYLTGIRSTPGLNIDNLTVKLVYLENGKKIILETAVPAKDYNPFKVMNVIQDMLKPDNVNPQVIIKNKPN